MSMDLEALKRELNVFLGRGPEEDLCYFSDNRAENCLGFAFSDFGMPRACFNGEKIIGEAARFLEEEIRQKTGVMAILKRYAAASGDASDGRRAAGVD